MCTLTASMTSGFILSIVRTDRSDFLSSLQLVSFICHIFFSLTYAAGNYDLLMVVAKENSRFRIKIKA